MNPSEMLQRMCHTVLAKSDLKAIVKSRGFPDAAVNPGILAGLFLTEQGVADAFKSLNREEIAALHLLTAISQPVRVSFFERIYGKPGWFGHTFTQRYQGVLASVKEQLVRAGVLLMCDVRPIHNETKMELWRFLLPVQFYPHLPPLLGSLRTFEGPGILQSELIREKLRADLCSAAPAVAENDASVPGFQIVDGELRLGGARFQAVQVTALRVALWTEKLRSRKQNAATPDAHSLTPTYAVYRLLSGVAENQWADPAQLDDLARVFAGQKVDCHFVCEVGWQAGVLAKREADGKSWYRLAPADPLLGPPSYLETFEHDKCVAIDLLQVPYSALETLVQLGDVRPNPSGSPSLLLTPNLVRLGRSGSDVLASEVAVWLFRHSEAFAQAEKVLVSRRGKTVLHSNVLIARVTDLSLKLALEKSLGENFVLLRDDYVAFPHGALGDIQRIVKKSGNVIKEVVDHER